VQVFQTMVWWTPVPGKATTRGRYRLHASAVMRATACALTLKCLSAAAVISPCSAYRHLTDADRCEQQKGATLTNVAGANAVGQAGPERGQRPGQTLTAR